MHVLYIGNFSPNSVGEPEIARAFEVLGHKVTKKQESETTVDSLRLELKKGYDVLLYAKLRIGHKGEVRRLIQETKTPTVCWLFDLYWGYHREDAIIKAREPIFFDSDIVFTTDGGHDHIWHRYGINHRTLRQGISDDVVLGEPMQNHNKDIGFVGTINTWAGWKYRAELVDWLQKNYDNFEHVGEDGNVRHKILNDYLATWKITIGDSVHSPYYWSNRIYEMLGRGAFLIHPKIKGLEEEFTPYKHYIPYRYGDFKGLKEKIDYYLAHDDEREAIRQAGYKYCHENHTYTHRVKKLIETLREEKICK